MMRRLAVVTVVAAATLAVTPTAHADTPGCVSRHEFDRVVKGMTTAKVHLIFDTLVPLLDWSSQ